MKGGGTTAVIFSRKRGNERGMGDQCKDFGSKFRQSVEYLGASFKKEKEKKDCTTALKSAL